MTEHPYFMNRGGERLFAFLHLPERPAGTGAVVCAPLAEEKLWSHRVLVSFARELAQAGYAVLRFDYRGEGDSDRRFEDSSLTTRVEDVHYAVDEVRRHLPPQAGMMLVGLRLGGTVAAIAAAQRADVNRLVLWEPVVNGHDYLQSILRANLMSQLALHHRVVAAHDALMNRLEQGECVNVEGYGLGGDLFRELATLDLALLRPAPSADSLIVGVTMQGATNRQHLAALAENWPRARLDHAVEEPFWREIRRFYARAGQLFDATFRWMGAP